MRQPLLFLSLAFAAGCLLGDDVGRTGGFLLVALAAAALALSLTSSRLVFPGLAAAAVALGAAGAGLEAAAWRAAPLGRRMDARASESDPLRVRGRAVAPVPSDGASHPLVLEVEAVGSREPLEPTAGRARVLVGGEAPREDIAEGDPVELTAVMGPPAEARSPGAFDPQAWARREGYQAVGYCKSPLLVRVLGPCASSRPRCAASAAREWARERLRRHVRDGPPEGLVRAMVLGDRSTLDEATSESFRRAGTYHVLALSGAQVALVAGLLVGAGRRASIAPLPLAALVAGALVAYATLVGADVPVTRAAVTAIVIVLGKGFDLDADLANLLGLAALVLLAAHPGAVADVGFQLSFGATLAIVLLAPGLLAAVPPLPWGLGPLIVGSLAAQAALQPFLAFHFHRLSPAALALNLAAVPLSGAVLLLGAAVLPVSLVSSWGADRVGDLAYLAADVLLRTCDGFGLAQAVDIRTPNPSLLVLVPWALSLRALARGRLALGLLLSVTVAGLLAVGPGPQADGRLAIAFLDVGQGDAIVLRSPSGRFLAVDAGLGREGFDQGERIVAPFLWWQRARRLDGFLLSHAHPDHAGGAPFLMGAFDPARAWEGPAPRDDAGYREYEEGVRSEGVTRVGVARGAAWSWDGVELEVWGPPGPSRAPRRTRNDDSVVLVARFGEVCAVFTGDIESAAEGASSWPSCPILKVPHHGSKTSTSPDLLRAVRPRIAVISAGIRNRFGHPHPDVLARLRQAGVTVLRTDRDGTLQIFTDGRRIWVRSGLGGVERRAL